MAKERTRVWLPLPPPPTAHGTVTSCVALRGEVFPHSVNPAENVTLPFWSKLQLHWTEICTTDDERQHISKGATETLGGARRSQDRHPSGPALVTKQCKEAESTAALCSLGGHPLQDILVSYKTHTQNSINRINTPIYRTLTHIHTWCTYGTPLVGNPRNWWQRLPPGRGYWTASGGRPQMRFTCWPFLRLWIMYDMCTLF